MDNSIMEEPRSRSPAPQNQSQAMMELNNILSECKAVKGKSSGELSEEMQNLTLELGVETLKRKI